MNWKIYGRSIYRVVTSIMAFVLIYQLSSPLQAQQAPIGDHHAAIVGSTGETSATGSYQLALEMTYPAARGGVLIPLEMRYNAGNKVGEGGLGWNIPMSYVLSEESFTRRRPHFASDQSGPRPHQRIWLVLDDKPTLMIPLDRAKTRFRPMIDSQKILLTREANHWTLKNGAGHVSTFEQLSNLNGDAVWFLTEINDSTGNNPIRLDYSVLDVETENSVTVPELRLNAIRYNFHPLASCAKHEIRLSYRPFNSGTSSNILDYTVQNGQLRARSRIVDRIDILARGNLCASTPKRIHSYKFDYGFDTDTLQPRLHSVDVFGMEGTAEESIALPVARYEYGSLSQGQIGFIETSTISVPNEAAGLASSAISSMLESANDYTTRHMLLDFNGDNRTDLLFPNGGFDKKNVWIARNTPLNPDISSGLAKVAFVEPKPLLTGDLAGIPLGEQVTSERRYRYGDQVNTEDTMVQALDFNGDGRTDILDARSKGFWLLYLNTPSATDPNSIEWKTKRIDTEPIRESLMSHGQWDITIPWPIPLKRSKTGRDSDTSLCWDFLGPSWKECPQHIANVTEDDQHTRTEWMLTDVNGDGWVDFVVNSVPISRMTLKTRDTDCISSSSIPKNIPKANESHRVYCDLRVRVDLTEPGNRLEVHLNMAGAQLRDDVQPFAPRIALESSSCAIEEWLSLASGSNSTVFLDEQGNPLPRKIGPWRSKVCGLLDVSGDGIPDRVRGGSAYLGTGQGYSISLKLPGPISRVYNGRDAVCGPDVEDPAPDAEYVVEQAAGYVDMTGDGILDYVSGDTARIGTGTGWRDEVPIASKNNSFTLSKSIETCEGETSKTVAGMFDVDGDGRLDLVEVDGGHIHMFQLVSDSGRIGAHDAGRIVRVENGLGARVDVSYTSAKNDTRAVHRVPFPEVVVHKVETQSGDGTREEPVHFAYGDADLRFDVAVDRWVFSGYGRTVSLRGQKHESSTDARRLLSGVATITDRVKAEELASGYETYALAGRVKDVHSLSGMLSTDVWSLLSTDFTSAATTFSGLIHYEYDSFHRTEAVPSVLDCTNMDDPYEMNGSVYFIFDKTKDWNCLSTGYGYAKTTTQSHGNVLSGNPSEFVLSRQRLLSLDDFGRPLLIAHDNDVFYEQDDICEKVSYARSTGGHHMLSAVHTRQFFHSEAHGSKLLHKAQTCQDYRGRPISGIRYVYDHRPDSLIEGDAQVSKGHQSKAFVQRYNTTTGNLIKEFELHSSFYDANGNVSHLLSARDDGVAPLRTSYGYDAFGLVETSASITSAGTTTVLETSTEFDPVTLLPVALTTPNDTIWKQRHDGFGRSVLVSVFDPSRQDEFLTSKIEYLGWSGGDPAGRSIRTRQVHDDLLMSDYDADPSLDGVNVSDTTTFIDEFGRSLRAEQNLGADYSGQVLVLDDVQFDSLGRPRFVADPYLKGSAGTEYGTSYIYRPDNSIQCTVQGRGPQTLLSASEQEARFPTCMEIFYEGHRRHVRIKGPEELSADSPHIGNYSESVTTALGAPLVESRKSADHIERERMEFDYDRLGNAITISRFQLPESQAGELVWSMQYDSFGQVVEVSEPRVATKVRTFDHWGNITQTHWVEEGVLRKSISEYDVLGRIRRTVEETDGIPDPATTALFHYDLPSTDPNHLSPEHLLGRLSHVSNAKRKVFLSYDGQGNDKNMTRVTEDGAAYSEVQTYGIDGSLESLSYVQPGTAAAQTASYSYDTARRVKRIDWQVGADVNEVVFDAVNIDPFGRYRRVLLGNGTEELRSFNEFDRREFRGYRLLSQTTSYQLDVNRYDSELRLLERQEQDSSAGTDLITSFEYDNVFRLAKRETTDSLGSTVNHERFTYDGLGNLHTMTDHVGLMSREFTTYFSDRDRLCTVIEDTFPGPQAQSKNPPLPGTAEFPISLLDDNCAYQYDDLGNVASIDETGQPKRRFEYDAHSRIKAIDRDGAEAAYRYGPLGEIAEIEVTGPATGTQRTSQRFGPLVEKSILTVPDTATGVSSSLSTLETRLVGPMGVFMAHKGDENIYWHSEGRGIRFATNSSGDVVQDVDYLSFGEVSNNDVAIGGQAATNYLFNGGDRLSEFDVTQMGARLYESKTGRFLQRDPFLAPSTAGKSHPYAFSWNDPVNHNDPSGLYPGCIGKECTGNVGLLGSLIGAGIGYGLEHIFGSGGGGGGQQTQGQSELKWSLLGIRNVGGPTEFERGLMSRKNLYIGRNDKVHTRATQLSVWDSQAQLMKPVGYSLGGSVRKIYDRYGNLITISEPGLESGFWYDPINFISGSGFVRHIVTRSVSKLLTKRAVSKTMNSIKGINGVKGANNCSSCAIATNATLSGIAAGAKRFGPTPMAYLARFYQGTFQRVADRAGIELTMQAAGSGSRGIVVGSYGWAGRHAFNVVNVRGTILFLDGQAGTAASFAGFKRLYFMRTF